MKAIHNNVTDWKSSIKTVFIPTKIQNESNSQPMLESFKTKYYCIYPYKDTK